MPPRRFQARNSLEKMIRRTREKVFGPGRAVPLDRNAKARIMAYARAWGARHAQPRQHRGPIIRAFLEVLEALLWGFHNSRDGRCFPSYEAIAAKAQCARSTVAESLKVLEWARVLTWQHRIARIQVRERDLFGRWASRWRAQPASQLPSPKIGSEPRIKKLSLLLCPCWTRTAGLPGRLGAGIKERLLMNKSHGTVAAI